MAAARRSSDTLFTYIAPTTINGEPSPWTGLQCVVLDRYGMSYAGFDCAIAFVDRAAFEAATARATWLEFGAPTPDWFSAAKLGWDDDLAELADGRPVMEANSETELAEVK